MKYRFKNFIAESSISNTSSIVLFIFVHKYLYFVESGILTSQRYFMLITIFWLSSICTIAFMTDSSVILFPMSSSIFFCFSSSIWYTIEIYESYESSETSCQSSLLQFNCSFILFVGTLINQFIFSHRKHLIQCKVHSIRLHFQESIFSSSSSIMEFLKSSSMVILKPNFHMVMYSSWSMLLYRNNLHHSTLFLYSSYTWYISIYCR